MNRKKNYAIILASGTGERAGLNIPKQFALINGKTILEYSIDTFQTHNLIDGIVLVSNPLFIDMTEDIVNRNKYTKIIKIVSGGVTRQESSYIGISQVKEVNANVLIHDAVRPFINKDTISECIEALNKYKAVNVAIESSDTIVEIDENNIIKNIPKRRFLRRCQTPQCFDLETIKAAHKLAFENNAPDITDDCGLVVRYNLADIFVVNGSTNNIKITYPLDLEFAELIQKKESR